MQLVYGDAWAVANSFNALCILTNGVVKQDGELVMGAGIALDCAQRYPQIPKLLGGYVKQYGNRVFNLGKDETTGIRLVSFPTKNNWKDPSDLALIRMSAEQLVELADKNNWTHVLVPRPGVGKGKLKWSDVESELAEVLDERFFVISNNTTHIANLTPPHIEENKIVTEDDIKEIDTVVKPQAVVVKPPVANTINPTTSINKNVLECSTKGDSRFSAFCAKVNIFNMVDTIENLYQLCKRFGSDIAPSNWKDCKGKAPTHIIINNIKLDTKYLTPWYKLLWLTYLDSNPELVAFASQFDDYNDMFKGKSVNCQADVIRQYIKKGRDSIVREVQELLDLFNSNMENNFPSLEDNTNEIVQDKVPTLCVTGHRPKDLWGYNPSSKYTNLQNKIYACIKQFYDQFSVRKCIQGGAQGIDQLFGDVVQYIHDNECTDLIHEVHVPFKGQEGVWLPTGMFSQQSYNNMLAKANRIIIVNPHLDIKTAPKNLIGKALTDRNISMVDSSDYVLGVYKGDINNIKLTDNMHSGTLHALQYAYHNNKPIVVINPMTLATYKFNF